MSPYGPLPMALYGWLHICTEYLVRITAIAIRQIDEHARITYLAILGCTRPDKALCIVHRVADTHNTI